MTTPAPDLRDIEIVTIRPRENAREELLALRPTLLAEYRAHFGDRFDAQLTELTGPAGSTEGERGVWIDVWRWARREDAEYALAHQELIPSFARWEQLVELESLTWSRVLA